MLVSNKETSIAKAGQIVRLFNDNKASRGDLVYRTKSAKQFDLLFDSISLN